MTHMLLTLTLALAASPAREDIESGPKPGVAVPKLKVDVVSGAGLVEGEADIASVRGDKPTLYAFVNAETFDRPLGRLLKTLDGKLGDLADAQLVAVWVGGDAAKSKQYLPRMQTSLKLARTALAVAPAARPEGWALSADAQVTVVVAVKGKVVESIPIAVVKEKDAQKVLDALTGAVFK